MSGEFLYLCKATNCTAWDGGPSCFFSPRWCHWTITQAGPSFWGPPRLSRNTYIQDLLKKLVAKERRRKTRFPGRATRAGDRPRLRAGRPGEDLSSPQIDQHVDTRLFQSNSQHIRETILKGAVELLQQLRRSCVSKGADTEQESPQKRRCQHYCLILDKAASNSEERDSAFSKQ